MVLVSGPPTTQTGVSISGTVSGTRIVAVSASDQIIAQDDTAGRTPNAQGQYAWSLGNLPIGTNLRLFFITGGTVYLTWDTNERQAGTTGGCNSIFLNYGWGPPQVATTTTTAQQLNIDAQDKVFFGFEMEGGAWQGRQMLPRGWTDELVKPCPVAPFYGLMWWLNTNKRQFAAASEKSYFALGWGSHIVWIDPDNDLVVVLRWIDRKQAPGFVERLLGALKK